MELGLDGKVAVVTGGSEGIGKATAARLCAEGAQVAVCARRGDVLESAVAQIREGTGGRIIGVPADVTDPGDIERFHDRACAELGAVDIVVNNVGTSIRDEFERIDDDRWREDFDLKVLSAVRLSRLAVPGMVQRRGGRIVNVLSIGGKHPGPASVPTSVTRAAGIALTKALSKEFAPYNVLVNAVCVGLIKSGQHDRRWRAQAPELSREDYYRSLVERRAVPLGRAGEAEEVANLIAFLASDAASYISGTAVNVDGGVSHVT